MSMYQTKNQTSVKLKTSSPLNDTHQVNEQQNHNFKEGDVFSKSVAKAKNGFELD